MNKKGSDDSIKKKIEKLTKRINNIEKRLRKLEKSNNPNLDSEKRKKSGNNNSQDKKEVSTNHNYLKRTISEAKERYERENKI